MSDLKVSNEQLEACGPYDPAARKIAMFSVANDFEAHGLPMPPHTDSLLASSWCNLIARRIGASYIAHIPYATDTAGDIALNWSPIYIPFEEFCAKVEEFVKWHVGRLSFKPEKIVIIIGHGGNRDLPERDDDLTKAVGVPVTCLNPGVSGPLVYPGFEPLDAVLEIVAKGGEHAYILEYSLIAHLGHLDYANLDVLNEVAAKDPLEALRRWPAIAGLGGYVEFGGPEFNWLKQNEGFRVAVEDFKKRREIIVDPELGRLATELIVSHFCERMVGD
jgi:creatinine amidohydrolase/Fe(II)-dependent formamide hydrolase-like protein